MEAYWLTIAFHIKKRKEEEGGLGGGMDSVSKKKGEKGRSVVYYILFTNMKSPLMQKVKNILTFWENNIFLLALLIFI